MEDLLAIQQLFVDYGAFLDAGDLDGYASLFADDGEVLLGPLGRATGPDAIKELMGRATAN
jgi:ketosteroid isomerase-like protein